MTLIKDVTVIQTLRFLMSSAQLEKSVDNASVWERVVTVMTLRPILMNSVQTSINAKTANVFQKVKKSRLIKNKQLLTINISDCECDDQSPNADEFCSAGETCKNCKCLPQGMIWIWPLFDWC